MVFYNLKDVDNSKIIYGSVFELECVFLGFWYYIVFLRWLNGNVIVEGLFEVCKYRVLFSFFFFVDFLWVFKK